jgi:predicted permease
MFNKIADGLRSLFRSEKVDHEMDDEIRGYLENATREKMRTGMSREEALRQARLEIGGVERVKEEVRAFGWESIIGNLWQDLRFGSRMLSKNPGFTAVAVLTLALGIGATTAIFTLMDAVMLKMLPVRHPEELVLLEWTVPLGKSTGSRAMSGSFRNYKSRRLGTPFSYRSFQEIRAHNRGFEDVFAFAGIGDNLNVVADGVAGLANGQLVSGNYFATLGIRPSEGRLLLESDDKPDAAPACVISESFRNRRFGRNISVVGRTVLVAGVPFTIVGVTAPEFFGLRPGSAVDISVPLATQPLVAKSMGPNVSLFNASNYWWLMLVGRLKPTVSAQQAIMETDVIFKQSTSQDVPPDPTREVAVPTLDDEPMSRGLNSLRNEFSRPLYILMALVVMVLMIACANVANLLLARGAARQLEIAMRFTLGAPRGRVLRQLLTESILLSFLGGMAGIAFAAWGCSVLVGLISSPENPVRLDAKPDLTVLFFTLGVCVLTGLLFGAAPAWRALRTDLTPAMKHSEGDQRSGGHRLGIPKLLVVAQTALTVILLFGAGLFVRTLVNLKSLNTGFDQENLLLFGINPANAGYKPAQLNELYRQVRERISTLPGVASASASRSLLLSGSTNGGTVWVPGFIPLHGESIDVRMLPVAPNFFATMRLPLLLGRDFTDRDDEHAAKVVIVNESFAHRFYRDRDPIGERFGNDNVKADIEIIGVAEDAKYSSIRDEVPATIYRPALQLGSSNWMYFEVRTIQDPRTLIPTVRASVATLAPDVPLFNVKTQTELTDESLLQERLFAKLASFFGVMALALACLGLYGVLSYGVVRRTHEIGIRMALGARVGSILRLVLRESAQLVFIGVVLGIPATFVAACLAASTISDFLFGVKVTDTATIATAASALLVVGVIATLLPARRAARVDPLVALRHE